MDIPQELFDIYNEFADDFISQNFGVPSKLTYPEKKIPCTNCSGNTMIGGRPSNFQSHGGPGPFNPKQNCSVCGGQGFSSSAATDNIKLRAYFTKKEWTKLGAVNVPEGGCVVIGFMSDLPKYKMANTITLCTDVQGINGWTYEKAGEAVPHGFKRNRYFMGVLGRSGK